MKLPFAFVATLALAGTIGLAPASAVSSSGDRSVTLNTAFAPQYYGAGEYDGVMHLTIAPDGTINGWYRPADIGPIHTVVGGLTGDKVWLDLGQGNLVDIQGTYDNGKIAATTYFDNQLYTFTASPTKS